MQEGNSKRMQNPLIMAVRCPVVLNKYWALIFQVLRRGTGITQRDNDHAAVSLQGYQRANVLSKERLSRVHYIKFNR